MKINRLVLAMVIGAVFCIAAWSVNAQLQSSRVVGQRWEYKNITASGAYWTENGKQLGGNAEQLLWPKLQELGDQGWELISTGDCANREGAAPTTLWFKRLK